MPKIKELKNLGLNSHNTEAVYEQLKGIVPQTYINHDSRDVIDGFLFIISEMIAETKTSIEELADINNSEKLQERFNVVLAKNFGIDMADKGVDKQINFIRNLPNWISRKGTEDSIKSLCMSYGYKPILSFIDTYYPYYGDIYYGDVAQKNATTNWGNLRYRCKD